MSQISTGEVVSPPIEFIVYPDPKDEMPGIRNFAALCGFKNPSNLPFLFEAGATVRPRQIIDGLIRIFSEEQGPETDILKITIDRLSPSVGASPESTLEETVRLLGEDPETKDAAELINLLINIDAEVHQQPQGDTDIDRRIVVSTRVVAQRNIDRLAEILGVPREQITNKDYRSLLIYIAELSRRVGELEDLAAYQTSLHVSGKKLDEVAMLSESQVLEQTGVECVLFATLNLAEAAKTQDGLVSPITLDELEKRIPTGRNPQSPLYRSMDAELLVLMKEKGFTVSGDFIWADAINLMQKRQAGLILTIFSDHALAVVGVKQNNDTPAKIEFLVANSLPDYWPGRKLSWVKADELISKTAFLKPGETIRPQLYLASWPVIKL